MADFLNSGPSRQIHVQTAYSTTPENREIQIRVSEAPMVIPAMTKEGIVERLVNRSRWALESNGVSVQGGSLIDKVAREIQSLSSRRSCYYFMAARLEEKRQNLMNGGEMDRKLLRSLIRVENQLERLVTQLIPAIDHQLAEQRELLNLLTRT